MLSCTRSTPSCSLMGLTSAAPASASMSVCTWGNPEWRDVCTKEMTRMEYLDMLRRHEPEKYKITLLALDATAYAYE